MAQTFDCVNNALVITVFLYALGISFRPRGLYTDLAYPMHDLVEQLAASTQFHNQVEVASIFKCVVECERVWVLANTLHNGNLLDNVITSVALSRFARQDLASILDIGCLHASRHW